MNFKLFIFLILSTGNVFAMDRVIDLSQENHGTKRSNDFSLPFSKRIRTTPPTLPATRPLQRIQNFPPPFPILNHIQTNYPGPAQVHNFLFPSHLQVCPPRVDPRPIEYSEQSFKFTAVENLSDLKAEQMIEPEGMTIVAFDIDGVILKSTHKLAYFTKYMLTDLDRIVAKTVEQKDRKKFKDFIKNNNYYRILKHDNAEQATVSYVDDYIEQLISNLNQKKAITIALTNHTKDCLDPNFYSVNLSNLIFSAKEFDFIGKYFSIENGIGYLEPFFASKGKAKKTIIISHLIDQLKIQGHHGPIKVVYIDDEYLELSFSKIANSSTFDFVSFEPILLRQLINETRTYYDNYKENLKDQIKNIYNSDFLKNTKI